LHRAFAIRNEPLTCHGIALVVVTTMRPALNQDDIVPSQEMTEMIELIASGPALGDGALEDQRAAMAAMLEGQSLPEHVTVTEIRIGSMIGDWVAVPESVDARVVLYLHGGGYVMGSNRTHRELASRIAQEAAARVLVLDYRLAPEHPFPAAVEDATAAYRWLREQGIAAASIAIAGDSAGGGLTLAALLALRDAGDVLPACAVCLSPWVDLEGTGASAQPGGADDPMIQISGLRDTGKLYAGDDLRNPLAAPLHGTSRGCRRC
jgi:epsilon-lactone hydrolase